MGAGSSASADEHQENVSKLLNEIRSNPEKKSELHELFDSMDQNGDEQLELVEAEEALRKFSKDCSDNDIQSIFCQIDTDGNGFIDKKEFIDFMCDGTVPIAKYVKIPPSQEYAGVVREAWKTETLEAHNQLRAVHGADALTWNDECYEYAKKCADHCQSIGGMKHCEMEGPSGRMGQNIFWMSVPGSSAEYATRAWYNEIDKPGYNFDKPGFTGGTGHFTQVVWRETTAVGMAVSEDGRFIVANYYPPGNWTMAGEFERNVLPQGADNPGPPPQPKAVHPPRMKKGMADADVEGAKSIEATEMTPELEAMFEGCPFPHFKTKTEQGFADGATVTVTKSSSGNMTKISVKIEKDGGYSMMTGSYGGGCH